ncbi:MAG: Protein-glutamate methylesterase/protein-glutamine glutaminase [Methanoregula sp. SKADARSKE-2]|nr:MAG: Protein-glutamate methylesterase/protein-glutamine glutaminase [Methanoregula sp. SKADARSKE-2]
MTNESILIVEDDGVIALRMQELLIKTGYHAPDPVAFGEDALEQIARSRPDLVLMDIELMGEIDGIETARLIQERFDIPVIYLTAYVDDHRLAKAKETTPYGYIVKPFMDRELMATIEMALHRHCLDRKLRESEQRYHAVVDKAAEGMILIDCKSRRLLEANPAFIRLAGYDRKELYGLDVSTILSGVDDDGEAMMTEICSETGYTGEVRIRCKDATLLDAEIATGVVSLKGANPMVSLVAHDITDRKRAAEALGQVNRKMHFLTQITRHDIANSLTAALSYNGSMKNLVQEQEAKTYLAKQEAALNTINRQIQFTKLYEEIGVKPPAWLSLEKVVHAAMAQFDRNLFDLPPWNSLLEIYADPLFEKVFYNLFENAIRHAGTLKKIHLSSRESGEGLIITVQDDGQGIAPEKKEEIFTRGFGSNTGLGFYLREILDITSITIRETGDEGKGARFEIVVPRGVYRSSDIPK